MGLRDSPYCSLQWQARLKLEVYGDCRALANPFHWDRVVFNQPGSKGYRADLPWVMKIRWDGELAAEVFVYVDDGIFIGKSDDQLTSIITELQNIGLKIEDQGHPADYVGVAIKRLCDGSLELLQRALIDTIINDAKLDDAKVKRVCVCVLSSGYRGSVLITRYQSLDLSTDDVPSIP